VSASERTAAGHRRYTEADVRRFYRVRALCGLGLSLGEVAAALREPEDIGSLRELLTAQLAALEDRSARLAEAASRVRGLLDRLASEVMPDSEQFLSTLEPLQIDVDQYLTEEQRAALTDGGADQLRQHVRDGTPPADPTVAALVERPSDHARPAADDGAPP
jgi:DNA-binding transcriptional MerR regulator